MKILGNIDLVKYGQILNALIHKLPDTTAITTTVTNEAQIAYNQNEKRIMYYDGTNLRKIATIADISATGSKTIVAEIDPHPAVLVVEGDAWFKKSTNTLQVRTNTGWVPAASNSANIPIWQDNTDFVTKALVIFNNQLWLNSSGTTNNDVVWTPANWTQIGGATLTKVIMNITPAILDTTTVGNVTRTGTSYNLLHSLGTDTIFTKIVEDSKTVLTNEVVVDANNITLTFNRSAEESGKSYVVTIAAI